MDKKDNLNNFTPLRESFFKKSDFVNKSGFSQIILKLDLIAHFFLMVFIATLGFLYISNKKVQEKNRLSLQENARSKNTAQAIMAAAGNRPNSVYINQQIVPVDKKYFNLPDKFILTMNGPIKKEIFGYLPYWLVDNLDSIDIKTVTSLAYFGLEVGADGQIVNDSKKDTANPYDIWQNDLRLKNFIAKAKRNKTKIILTFKSFNNEAIQKLLTSPESSQRFIETVLYQVNSRNLDGVNIDFEYTGNSDIKTRDKFSVLMSTLQSALKRQNSNSTLTISVFASAATNSQLWDLPYLSKHSDHIIIMGYDFFTPNSSFAGPVAPVSGYDSSLIGMLNNFLEQIPPEKIILAVPYYGYDWTTENQNKNSTVVSNSNSKAISYSEANDIAKGKSVNWDDESKTPWFSYIDLESKIHVVHFENIRSLGAKYDLVNSKKFAGTAIWALGFEGNDMRLTQLLIDKFTH